MRFELLLLGTVDSSLGRVDRESLPQQTLMEMVIDGITNKEEICGDLDEPKDIEEWNGVLMEDGEVVEINWDERELTGSLHLGWLPSSVRKFNGSMSRLTGTVDLANLPIAMTQLELGLNAFTGSIDIERLPPVMEFLNVSSNELIGSLNLGSLPKAMTDFFAHYNKFSGSIDLSQLPAVLARLSLAANQLSANPTKGHLSVVGWTSTPVLGEAKNLFKPLVVFLSWRRPY
ncbi:leucine-rich repeat protein [Perkinsela sp. CCAP 1560/4]|nr:leucine-rich repeat protein [Perkinsela sp. CCAP 1560/4]KNH08144.1 leucine-rich repeat protein [Perkinsela sp. CCAP 1560/4]|eukprot:KNH06899.1 leucine-rich repeat protein [Perkinsela sp. CCAP 1560/4]